jgi:hypothetical protein
MVRRDHLFVSSADGGLYDTRKPDWHKGPPCARTTSSSTGRSILLKQFKATWRARHHSNYPVAFLTDDGELFSARNASKNNLGRILSSIRSRARDGWRVVGVGQCHGSMDDEPGDMNDQCANCNKNLGRGGLSGQKIFHQALDPQALRLRSTNRLANVYIAHFLLQLLDPVGVAERAELFVGSPPWAFCSGRERSGSSGTCSNISACRSRRQSPRRCPGGVPRLGLLHLLLE